MRIIPVIDILNGYVVFARAGKRNRYKRLKSWLCTSSNPLELASNYIRLGFKEIYAADLDSLLKGYKNIVLYKELAGNTSLILDIGVKKIEDVALLYDLGIKKIVVATETLPKLDLAKDIIDKFPSDRLVVSIDILEKSVMSKSPELYGLDPEHALKIFRELGYEEALVIDLSRVGTGEGVDTEMIRKLLNEGVKIIVGGGVRDINDISMLNNLNVEGVLIAYSLHKKRISVNELLKYI